MDYFRSNFISIHRESTKKGNKNMKIIKKESFQKFVNFSYSVLRILGCFAIILILSCILGFVIILIINNILEYYIISESVLDEDKDLIFWTAALVFSTIFLGIVAAYQDIIRGWFKAPKLDFDMDMLSQDCHKTKVYKQYDIIEKKTNKIIRYIDYAKYHYVYYFRFKIHNYGNMSAKNVEVILKDVKDGEGNSIELSLDNLLWSSLVIDFSGKAKNRIYWDYISPKTYQYCNLGDIIQPNIMKEKHSEYIDSLNLKDDTSIFRFSIYWKTPDLRYLLKPGTYTFQIIAGCENGKSITKNYKLSFNGEWTENEDKMLKENIKIEET
jgi:hypothetical protein